MVIQFTRVIFEIMACVICVLLKVFTYIGKECIQIVNDIRVVIESLISSRQFVWQRGFLGRVTFILEMLPKISGVFVFLNSF